MCRVSTIIMDMIYKIFRICRMGTSYPANLVILKSCSRLFHEFESTLEFQPAWSTSQKRNSLTISLLTIYSALGIAVAFDHSRPNSSAKFCTSVQNFILHSPGPSTNHNPQRQAVSRFEGRMLMRKATRL